MSLIFSERYGFKPIRDKFQSEDMDDDLRTGIWNSLQLTCLNNTYGPHIYNDKDFVELCEVIWINFMKRKINEFPSGWSILQWELEQHIFGCEWYEVYDLLNS